MHLFLLYIYVYTYEYYGSFKLSIFHLSHLSKYRSEMMAVLYFILH